MEIQLKELIDQIKKDGVDAAETEAGKILENAKQEAEKIIADAKAKAEKLMQDAKDENARTVKSSEEAIRQAGRNLLITFRESVARELNAILEKSVESVYSPEALAKLITKLIENWSANPQNDDMAVILNESDLKALEDTAISALKEKLNGGVTLKPNDNFVGGFRIAVNSGQAFYDYSTESVVDMLSTYLSPKVTEILKEAE